MTDDTHATGSGSLVPAGWPRGRAEDGASLEALMRAFDEVLCFQPGAFNFDRERFLSLFLPTASIVSPEPWNIAVGPEGFASFIEQAVGAMGFDETGLKENNYIVQHLAIGTVHNVLTYYELLSPPDAQPPIGKGVNMWQAIELEGRFWFTSLIWEEESESAPTPADLVPVQFRQA